MSWVLEITIIKILEILDNNTEYMVGTVDFKILRIQNISVHNGHLSMNDYLPV